MASQRKCFAVSECFCEMFHSYYVAYSYVNNTNSTILNKFLIFHFKKIKRNCADLQRKYKNDSLSQKQINKYSVVQDIVQTQSLPVMTSHQIPNFFLVRTKRKDVDCNRYKKVIIVAQGPMSKNSESCRRKSMHDNRYSSLVGKQKVWFEYMR